MYLPIREKNSKVKLNLVRLRKESDKYIILEYKEGKEANEQRRLIKSEICKNS